MSSAQPVAITPNASTTDIGAAIGLDEIKRLKDAFPLVSGRGGDMAQLARVAGVSMEVAQSAMDDPHTAALLLDEQIKAEDDGRLLKPVAARLTLAMLHKLNEAVAAGELDVDDIGSLLPKVHRVVEHADRIEAARGDGFDRLPTFNITFVNGRMQGRVEPPMVEVVFDDTAAMQPVEAPEPPAQPVSRAKSVPPMSGCVGMIEFDPPEVA